MSKYIYYNGKIYTGDIDTIKALAKHLAHFFDGKEFDNFEDLIEAGDLIFYRSEGKNYIESTVFNDDWFQCFIKNLLGVEILEIWKRIDNTFVRVCRKEEGQWVID